MTQFIRWNKKDRELTLNLCTSYTHGAMVSISKDEDSWMDSRIVTLSRSDLRHLILTAVKLLGKHEESKISIFAERDHPEETQ